MLSVHYMGNPQVLSTCSNSYNLYNFRDEETEAEKVWLSCQCHGALKCYIQEQKQVMGPIF